MEIRLTDFIKSVFCKCLQAGFSADIEDLTNYRYDPDLRKSKIGIWTSFPRKMVKVPFIVVSAEPSDASIAYLDASGEGLSEDVIKDGNVVAKRVRGKMVTTAKCSIVADSPTDRAKITDLAALMLRFIIRFKVAEAGIGYKDIKVGTEGEETIAGEQRFTNSITLSDCYTEFEDDIPIEIFEKIEAIQVTTEAKGPSIPIKFRIGK